MRKIMNWQTNQIFLASILVAVSGILYGFLGFLGTHALREHMDIPTMLFWRFLIAGIWMFCFSLKNYMKQKKTSPALDKRVLLFMFALGAVGYAGSSGFYFLASQYTGTGLAMVIFFSYPIMIAMLSWMFHRHRLSKSIVFMLLIITAGLFLLQDYTSNQINMMGILFGVGAAICYAFYVIGSKQISTKDIDSNILAAFVCFGGTCIFLTWSVVSRQFVIPQSMNSWEYLLALGVFTTALPIQLMLEALKSISSMRASIISVLEPLVTLFVGIFLLNESVSSLQMLGVGIILVGALMIQFQKEL